MKIIIHLLLLFPTFTFAQSFLEEEIEKERTELESKLTLQQQNTARVKGYLESESVKLADLEARLKAVQNYEQNFPEERKKTLESINAKIKSFNFFQKMGEKASFYKCLRDTMQNSNYLREDRCSHHDPNLTTEERAEFSAWINSAGIAPDQAARERQYLPGEIKLVANQIDIYTRQHNSSLDYLKKMQDSLQMNQVRRTELKYLETHAATVNCNEASPTLSLEEKGGPFDGIRRDNQDGIGSCFANAAKNLLVSISGGKDVASFLDMALVYKKTNGSLDDSGLDGGHTCSTLNEVAKVGYCPQQFAPIEIGERNQLGEGLFNLGPYEYMGTNITLVQGFIGNLNEFKDSSNPIKHEILAKAKSIIDTVKANPLIVIPLPGVSQKVADTWKIREFYHLNKSSLNMSEKEFMDRYNEQNDRFLPIYVQALMSGEKADSIFQKYEAHMASFIQNYNMSKILPELKRLFKIKIEKEMKDPLLKNKMTASMAFLKDVFGKKDMSDQEFLSYCVTDGSEALGFLSSFKPLIDKINEKKLNGDMLFDEDGKMRDVAELMQLTVAPACLNAENRKPVPPFNCNDNYDTINRIKTSALPLADQHKAFRERIILSLAQGYGVGNTFYTSPTTGHINTIVGIRFNKASNRCEYLIRESQTGTSDWEAESDIFSKISSITEVRRAP